MLGYLKIGGAIALALMLATLAWEKHRADHFAGLDQAHRQCIASIKPGARAELDPVKLCDAVIAADHGVAARARVCDDALGTKPENTFGLQQACSTPVKTVVAQRDAAALERDGLQLDLDRERNGHQAALRRATQAATTQAERKARADAAVQAAPRDSDGLTVCNADCMRARWGAEAGPAHRP
jgi:hypothetical protein